MKKIYYFLIVPILLVTVLAGCTKDSGGSSFFDSSSNSSGGIGTGGSLARFIIVGDYLYIVDHNMLSTYSISDNGLPTKTDAIGIGFNIETIFNMGTQLFIGSQSAMYVYDISVPSKPSYTSSVQHFRSCDPVVANEQYAYVTLRSSATNPTACGGNVNGLFIYNITNIQTPILVNSINMENPHGLALTETNLYICDGDYGLRVMSTRANPEAPEEIRLIKKQENSYMDCFVKDGYLYTMMKNGFLIYDISDPDNPQELGSWLH